MMRKIFFVFVFLFFIFYSKGQNLVPNWSYESFSSCPSGYSQIHLASPWYDPTGATSDFYHSCSNPSFAGVPSQGIYLFQPARTGSGYAGFYAVQPLGTNFREYIQVELLDTLETNQCYVVSFYVNLANYHRYAINNIGAYISHTAISVSSPNPYNINPHISNPSNLILSDTINWVEIKGLYTATGGEKYLTIGNFKDDFNTNYYIIDTSVFYTSAAYYYVDDVSVINCNDTSTSVQENKNDYNFSLYPNPSTGNFSIKYDFNNGNGFAIFKLYDIRGKLLNETVLKNENTSFNFSDVLANGIYFYQLSINNKIVKSDKVVIIK